MSSASAADHPAATDYTVVVPTVGRPSLFGLLAALECAVGPVPEEIVVVDDRRGGADLCLPAMSLPVRALRTHGRGPAAARNAGWRSAFSTWIAFLDDDVLPAASWYADVTDDIAVLEAGDAASAAVIRVPLPTDRAPTDAERGTAGLSSAQWITADMVYRRSALIAVGGFDERFRRAYREDADLAVRVRERGLRLRKGNRITIHPPADGDVLRSVRAQAGNADDALMRRKHGAAWRLRADVPRGRLPWHIGCTAAGVAALGLASAGRRVPAALAASIWAAGTAEFAWRRIRPGPRTAGDVGTMLLTSVLIPPVACVHRLRGEVRARRLPRRPRRRPAAVLFDRDDTIIVDVPYLNEPERVEPVPQAVELLDSLRRQGLRIGVVTNQSGVARGLISSAELKAVNERVDAVLGPFDTWQVCVHDAADNCGCRKPLPGMVVAAAADLGVDPAECVVIGDTGADVAAALAAGADAILVPTARTRATEVRHATAVARVAPDLAAAVNYVMAAVR